MCQPILISQATNLDYTKAGVSNTAATFFWVNCPLTFDDDVSRNEVVVYADSQV